jgi:transposase
MPAMVPHLPEEQGKEQVVAVVMIGVDPHKGSHTAVAAGGDEQLLAAGERVLDVQPELAAAVLASGTSLTRVFGAGPVIAAIVIGDVRDVSRFASRDHFAAYDATAPIEVSSGKRKVHRLSRRGNRRINHAIHMTAVTQIRYPHSEGRAYYDKKLAEGKTPKEALRALKRQVSDAIYEHLKADAAAAGAPVREGTRGTTLSPARLAGQAPACPLFLIAGRARRPAGSGRSRCG